MLNHRTSVVPNEVRNGYALLSLDSFLSLDRAARRLATRPIRVRRAQDMLDHHSDRQLWGALNYMSSSVCLDLRRLTDDVAEHYAEILVIDLANRVKLSDFRAARRPEIDWQKIPDDRIFEFIVMHEVGHALDNFRLDFAGKYDETVRKAAHICNEVLADRYAWKVMFPNRPLPTSPERTCTPSQIRQWKRVLQEAQIRRGKVLSRAKLSEDPCTFVPAEFFDKPIAWPSHGSLSAAGASYLAALRRARTDRRNAQRRWWRKQAKKMAGAWLDFGRHQSKRVLAALKRGNLPIHIELRESQS